MSPKTLAYFKFDDFYLDVDEQCLRYRDQLVPLTPKAFQTLLLLLRNHGRVVEKEDFLSEVWADTFVVESTLAQNILTVRKSLSRYKSDKDFIVTMPRRGYQFVGEVEEGAGSEGVSAVDNRTETRFADKHMSVYSSLNTLRQRSGSSAFEAFLQNGWSVRTAFFASLLLICTMAIAYVAWLRLSPGENLSDVQFRKFRMDTIVADADIRNSTISPNGKHLALIQVKNGVQSLYARQIETGNTVEIVPDINGEFIGFVFSPSNDEIYFSVRDDFQPGKSAISTLYKVSVQGGAPRAVLNHIDSPVAISADGRRLAFVRRDVESDETALVLTDIEGNDVRRLVVRPSESGFSDTGVSWSPNGKLLAATVLHREETQTGMQVAVIDAKSGDERIISKEHWVSAGPAVWQSDGKGILTVAYGAKSPTLSDELWVVSYPDGKSRFVTSGLNGAYGLSLNAATNSVVAVESNKFACFLTAPVDNLYRNTHVLTTISDECMLPFGADWTADGKILYSATDAGNADIFTISEDGSERKQLTSDASAEILPRLSADGRHLIFLSNRTGQMDVWRADANGTNTKQLTTIGNVKDSIISPSGETVFFLAQDADTQVEELWRVSINGEDAVRLTHRATRSPRVSPDGKTIACYFSSPETGLMTLTLISTETGQVLKYLSTPSSRDIPFLDWSKDGRLLFVVLRRDESYSLWKLPVDGSQAEQLREWENDAIFRLAVSRNGERVFYEVGNQLNSVVQLQSLD